MKTWIMAQQDPTWYCGVWRQDMGKMYELYFDPLYVQDRKGCVIDRGGAILCSAPIEFPAISASAFSRFTWEACAWMVSR